MMKIVVRIMYGILVLLMGFVVFSDSSFQRTQKFYFDSATDNLKEGKLTEFVHDTMLITGSNRFLNEPIYRVISEDSKYSFNLTIYHFQQIRNKKIDSGIIFYISNFKSTEEVDGISLRFISNTSNIFADTNMTTIINNENVGGNVVDPIIFNFSEKAGFVFNNVNNESIVLSQIVEIELRTLTIENDEMEVDNEVFAVIKHNEHHDINNSNEFQFIRNGDILELNNFSGNILDYKELDDKYLNQEENNNIYTITDLTKLEPYNYVITRTMGIYIAIALVGTYILFFLKPTINKIKELRDRKQVEENEEKDVKNVD